MHTALKPILFVLLYLVGVHAFERLTDLNALIPVWKFLYLYSYSTGKELSNVISSGPSIFVAVFSVVYFRRKIKTVGLRDLSAIVISVVLCFLQDSLGKYRAENKNA